jgi:hypothetical protein
VYACLALKNFAAQRAQRAIFLELEGQPSKIS